MSQDAIAAIITVVIITIAVFVRIRARKTPTKPTTPKNWYC